MTISHGYATSAQFFAFAIPNAGTSTGDDAVIEQIIEGASRVIDNETRRTFYARGETRYYDTPDTNTLYIEDDDLLSIAKLTNGDATEVTSGDYFLLPNNESPKYAVKIRGSSSVVFEFDAKGDKEQAISISGSWGYSTTAPKDIEVACLQIAANVYHRRYGENDSSETTITAGGVVVTPNDIPASARAVLSNYMRLA